MEINQPIKPIPKDLLHQKVTDAIISYIHQNGLKPGDKLPSERQLAEKFSVGRNSVRLGMHLLENENLVERITGKGSFVKKEVSAKSIQLKLMSVNYKDLLEMKICLERLAIRRAFEIVTTEQIAILKEIALRHCALAEEGIFSIEIDREYHIALLDCGGSETLSQVVLSLIDSLNNYTGMLGNASESWLKTVPYHLDIANAIEHGQLTFAIAAHEYIFQFDLKALNSLITNKIDT